MDSQNPKQNQNLKQAQGHASGCRYTVEVKCDDLVQIQKKEQSVSHPDEQISKKQATSQDIKQVNKDAVAEMQKPKRPRKTIEQELAELDAKRQKLIEKKRSQDTHEKIIFGATVIAMLKDIWKKGDPMAKTISDKLNEFAKKDKGKDFETIRKITAQIFTTKPEVNIQQ